MKHNDAVKVEWWIEKDLLGTIEAFAKKHDMTRAEAIGALLGVSLEMDGSPVPQKQETER